MNILRQITLLCSLCSLFVVTSCISIPQPEHHTQQELAWSKKLLAGNSYRTTHNNSRNFVSRTFNTDGTAVGSNGVVNIPGEPRCAGFGFIPAAPYVFDGTTLTIGSERYTLLAIDGESLKVANKGGRGPSVQIWEKTSR